MRGLGGAHVVGALRFSRPSCAGRIGDVLDLAGSGGRPFVGWLPRFTAVLAAASVRNVGTTASPSIAGRPPRPGGRGPRRARRSRGASARILAARRARRSGAFVVNAIRSARGSRRPRQEGRAAAARRRGRRAGPRGRVEQRRGVAHRQGDGVSVEQPPRPSPARRIVLRAARRLQADQPAARRRRADRAEAVGGMRHRQHARADRRGRAAARAAGDACRVPGILRRRRRARLAGQREAELARVRPAEEHQPGALQTPDVLAVGRDRRRVGEEAGAARRCARPRATAEVLQEKRHAAERPVGQPVGDRRLA